MLTPVYEAVKAVIELSIVQAKIDRRAAYRDAVIVVSVVDDIVVST